MKTNFKKFVKLQGKICGIIIAILIVVFVFLKISGSVWFWNSWEIFASLLVAIGCLGEWYLFKKTPQNGLESHHRKIELLCLYAVAIGVTLEFLGLFHAIPEAVRLEKDVAQIGTTNAHLVTSNLLLSWQVEQLRSNNFVLQKESNVAQSNMMVLYFKNEQTSNTARMLAEQTSNFFYTIRVTPNGGFIIRPAK